MTVVKADGYGHGIVESVARPAAGRRRLARGRHRARGAHAARGRRHGRLLCWLTLPADVEDGSLTRAVEPTSTSRRTPSSGWTRSSPPARGTGRASSSRSTPGCPAAAPPSPTGRRWSRARPSTRGRAGRGSPASGRTSPAATSPTTPPTTCRRRASTSAAASPSGRPATRGHATSPTPPPRSCGRAAATTWCACGLASYGLDPAPDVAHGTDLRPAMTVRAPLALAKRIAEG